MKRKVVSLAIIVTMLLMLMGPAFGQSKELAMAINNKVTVSSVAPVFENGTIYVPLRVAVEGLEARIFYDIETKEVIIISSEKTVRMKAGSTEITVDKTKTNMSVAPKIRNDVTFVPIWFFTDVLEYPVLWDQRQDRIFINDNKTPVNEQVFG